MDRGIGRHRPRAVDQLGQQLAAGPELIGDDVLRQAERAQVRGPRRATLWTSRGD
jgi:hypothetical protein